MLNTAAEYAIPGVISLAVVTIVYFVGKKSGRDNSAYLDEDETSEWRTLFFGIAALALVGLVLGGVKIFSPTPQMEAKIEQIMAGWNGDDPTVPALSVVFVTISNSGPPSIARNFEMSAELNGLRYEGKIYPMPAYIDAYEGHERYKKKDDLILKSSTPIPTGDFTQGILVVNFSNLDQTMLRLSTYTLRFSDIAGKQYETTLKPFANRRAPRPFPKLDIEKIP